jgi:hypothetical protein
VDKFIRKFVKELKDSRLWPVAAALVLALVAVPLLLAKPAKEEAAVAPAPVGAATPGTASPLSELKPIADVKDASAATERKSVDRLPSRNPFEPLKKDAEAGATGATGAVATAPAGTTGPVGATSGGTAAGGDTGSSTGSGAGTGTGDSGSTGGGSGSDEQKTFYYTFVADVTFGKVDETKRRKIQQLRALPSSDLPVIVFMGATSDGDKAVFLVGSGADVTGDGTCKPSDEQCSFLYMKPGDNVTIVVGDASGSLTTYELKLHKISIEKLEEQPGATSSSIKKHANQKQAAQISKQEKRLKRIKRAERRKADARAKGFFQLFDRLGF